MIDAMGTAGGQGGMSMGGGFYGGPGMGQHYAGYGMGNHGYAANAGQNMGTGGLDNLIGGLLNLVADLFVIVLVVAVVLGVFILIKKYLFEGDFITAKPVCTNCGSPVNAGWANCPYCGQSRVDTQHAPVAKEPAKKTK